MFSFLRGRLGVPGILGIVALVFAMVGGAWAAGGLTKQQEKQVTKIAKKYAGKPGAPGSVGPQGSPGSGGSAGAKGDKGEAGAPGKNGENVKTTSLGPGEGGCTEGGTKFEVGGSSEVICNGEKGPEGALGTAGTTLPEGATETGAYFAIQPESLQQIGAPISFNIPLSGPLDEAHSIYVPAGNTSTAHCSAAPLNGTAANPKAEEGYFCVYGVIEEGLLIGPVVADPSQGPQPKGAARSGAVVSGITSGIGVIRGTWAVTGS